jgi:hypothetical protein
MPACCHRRSVSTIGCPPNRSAVRVRASRCPGCPAARCRALPVSACLAPRPDAAVRLAGVQPSGVQPPGVRQSARSQPSRVSRVVRWGTAWYGGQRSRPDRVEFHVVRVVRPRPQRLGRRPEEARGAGTAAGAVWRPAGSVGGGPGPGGARAGGCTRPTRQARPPRGTHPVAGDGARVGELAGARGCRTAPCGRPPGPGVATTLRGCYGACRPVGRARTDQTSSAARMARGPSAAQAGGERDRLDAGNAVTCENGGGRDRV